MSLQVVGFIGKTMAKGLKINYTNNQTDTHITFMTALY